MGKCRALTTCKYSRYPAPINGQHRMPNGIHPAVHSMELAGCGAPGDPARAYAHGHQLPRRNDAMLPCRKLRDGHVEGGLVFFLPYRQVSCHTPMVVGGMWPICGQKGRIERGGVAGLKRWRGLGA